MARSVPFPGHPHAQVRGARLGARTQSGGPGANCGEKTAAWPPRRRPHPRATPARWTAHLWRPGNGAAGAHPPGWLTCGLQLRFSPRLAHDVSPSAVPHGSAAPHPNPSHYRVHSVLSPQLSSSGGFRASTHCVPGDLPALRLISPLAVPRAPLHATAASAARLPGPSGILLEVPTHTQRHLGVGRAHGKPESAWCARDQRLALLWGPAPQLPRGHPPHDGGSFRAQAHCARTLASSGRPTSRTGGLAPRAAGTRAGGPTLNPAG